MGRLAGRVIVVIGGASGLGEGIVRRAAEDGGQHPRTSQASAPSSPRRI